MASAPFRRFLAPAIEECRPVFLCCDLQAKFSTVIPKFNDCVFVANRMLNFAALHGERCLFLTTEHYPKGLGRTTPDIPITSPPAGANVKVFEKALFSMITQDVEKCMKAHTADAAGEGVVVLFGIESHVCVLQTLESLSETGNRVFVLADGTYSQRDEDRKFAMKIMQKMPHVTVTTSESLLFQFTRRADHPTFKGMSALVRQRPPQPSAQA